MTSRFKHAHRIVRGLAPFVFGASVSIGFASNAFAGNPLDDIFNGVGHGIDGALENPKSLPCERAWDKLENDKNVTGNDGFIPGKFRPFVQHEHARLQQVEANARNQAVRCSPIDALAPVVDDVAQQLTAKLVLTPEIAKAQNKQVLVIGDIHADSGIRSAELDMAIRSIASKLHDNPDFRRNFVVLSMTSDDAKNALAAAGANKFWQFQDGMDPTSPSSDLTSYNPRAIYVLTGDFLREWDGNNNRVGMTYKMLVTVDKASDRTLVQSVTVTEQYRFHPYRSAWLSQADDDQLEAAYQQRHSGR